MIANALTAPLASLLLAANGTGSAPADQTASPSARPALETRLALQPHRLPGWSEDVLRGEYEVYEDRSAQSGRKISLRVVVLRATGAQPAPDPVFYLAGGPGGSAVDTITRAGASFLAGLRRDRDLVFVDQRGTGGSHPLACTLHADPNDMASYFDDPCPIERVKACRDELLRTADLTLYTTSIAADDLDDVRAALGYERINLYGGSYGSRAGLVYLRRHPEHVRTATLFGVAPPWAHLPLSFSRGFDNALERLCDDCASDAGAHASFPDPKAELDAVLARLEQAPAEVEATNPFTKQAQHVRISRAAFADTVRVMLYTPEFTRWLPLLIHRAAAGDFALFASVGYTAVRGIEDLIARGMSFSVICSEDLPFVTDEDVAREITGSRYRDTRYDPLRRVSEVWPHADVPASFLAPITADVPVLLISGEADPVTPPWLADETARHLPASRHVIVPRTGHFFSFPCVDELVAAFVARGSVHDLDATCVATVRRPAFVTEAMLGAMQGRGATEAGTAPASQQTWRGVLEVGATKLRLAVKLTRAADGKLGGTIDSPDQGVNGIPIDAARWQDSVLHLDLALVNASYEGTLDPGGTRITGHWQQSGKNLPLDLTRDPAEAK